MIAHDSPSLFEALPGLSGQPSRQHRGRVASSREGTYGLREGRFATIAFLGSARICALLRMRRIHGQHLVISIHFDQEPLFRIWLVLGPRPDEGIKLAAGSVDRNELGKALE